MTNRKWTTITRISLVILIIGYLTFDYLTCYTSIINQLYFNNKKVIEWKYLYFVRKDGSIDNSVEHIWHCENGKVDSLKSYYNEITKNLDFFDGWFKAGDSIEILHYNYKDSVAAVRVYNTESKRFQKEGFVIISLKCLHDSPLQIMK